MTINKSGIVCQCNGVTRNEVLKVLKKGARNFDDVKKFTLASTGCGRCKNEIETITNQYLRDKSPDPQQNIIF
jgi:NAD(P)H-nitrite reductase large subunit